jgi:hypothetical protein
MKLTWENRSTRGGGEPVPVSLCPPPIPHGLTQDRTRASAVRGRRLTASAVARPSYFCGIVEEINHVSDEERLFLLVVYNS